MRAWLLAIALMLFSLPAVAQGIVGKLGYGGTGCPGGTAAVALSGSTLNIRFQRFEASAGGVRSFDRKSCNLAIPFKVPAGKSVSIVGLQYTGFNRLPAGSMAEVRVELFMTGGRGPILNRTFKGPSQGRFTLTSASAGAWSACGADTILRTNTSVRVTTTSGRLAVSSLKSQEVNAALVYRLKWRSC